MISTQLSEFEIPDEAVRYILFQRTSYLKLPVTLLYRHFFSRLPFETRLYNVAVAVESRFGKERVKRLYQQDMAEEFGTIRESLPAACSAVLDIGCGVAGIDVLLDRHYAGQQPQIHLLDRSETSAGIYYLFRDRAAFYNSLEVARTLLTRNGIPPERIYPVTATDQFDIPVEGQKFDLVVSLLSWGFHYPVQTYASQVAQLLTDRGRVILDIRNETDGLGQLGRHFRRVQIVRDFEKFKRVIAST